MYVRFIIEKRKKINKYIQRIRKKSKMKIDGKKYKREINIKGK